MARNVHDVGVAEHRLLPLELLIEAPERRARVARYEARNVEARIEVASRLFEDHADDRLDPAEDRSSPFDDIHRPLIH